MMVTTTRRRRRRRRSEEEEDDEEDEEEEDEKEEKEEDDDDDDDERTLDECEKGKRKRRLMGKEVGKSSFNPSALRDYKTWHYPDTASQYTSNHHNASHLHVTSCCICRSGSKFIWGCSWCDCGYWWSQRWKFQTCFESCI